MPVVMPSSFVRPRLLAAAILVLLTASCGGGGDGDATPPPPPVVIVPVDGPAWLGFAGDAQHSAVGAIATQPLASIKWSAPLDLAPQRTPSGALLTHYGSPVVTAHNVVLMPVKTGATGPFRVEARIGQTGDLLWSLDSDYRVPLHRWMPSFNVTLSASRLAMPLSGGRVLVRDDPESATGATHPVAFYGESLYQANAATFDATVFVNTPITADSHGNLYFGYSVAGTNPAGLAGGGIVRIAPDGSAIHVAATDLSGDAGVVKTALNSAPALSRDESTLYVVLNGATTAASSATAGHLVQLDSTTLARRAARRLLDPASLADARVTDDGTASPAVGPDGDVYIGVLESSQGAHNSRGWLLHFDATLATAKIPASFGWDLTPSVVPASMIPSYAGPSTYLLAIKDNNYAGAGTGDGMNRVAIVDPGVAQADPITSSVQVMREVQTKLGPTADAGWGVKEWCINTAAVDPLTSSVLVNSEDGFLYRWHLPSNTFSERIQMNNGVAQSYTPTLIAPDGRVYSVNNATLFAIGR
jgi:hypothetical protein